MGAVAVFVAGSVGCAAAPSMLALILARALQGLGGGGLMVLSQALIGELVPPVDRPRYQGYFAMIFTASSVGGPLVGGLVVHYADWRWLFGANVPLGALAAWRVSRLPAAPRSAQRDGPRDPVGLLLFALTACAALLWLSLSGHRFPWVSAPGAALLAVAAAAGAALLHQQRRHPAPLLPLDLLRLPGVPWICATVMCFAASLFALVFLLPIHLQIGHGSSASSAGWQMLPLTGGLVLGATLNSRITLRTLTPARTPPWGLAAAAVALLAMGWLPAQPWALGLAAGIVGLGFGTVMPAAQLSTQMLAGRERLGVAAALLSLARSCGASLGTAAFGGLVFTLLRVQPHEGGTAGALQLGNLSPAQINHAFHVAYLSLAVFVALGAWAASRVPRVRLAAWAPAPSPAVE